MNRQQDERPYPVLQQAIDNGRIDGSRKPDPAKRELRTSRKKLTPDRIGRIVLFPVWLAAGAIAGSHGADWGWVLFFGFAAGESWMGIWRWK